MTDASVVVEVRGLTKSFALPNTSKRVQACTDVSFQIRQGETFGLVGESGSGKTTVGRCLVRLLSIDRGEIYFRGARVERLSMARFRPYRKRMQIVFQEPYESLDPLWSVGLTIEEPIKLHTTMKAAGIRDRVKELLELVGLESSVAGSRPSELSAGAQQRVAIARALAANPDFVVLDEPTSSLPPDAKPGIMRLLKRLQSDLNLAYLFISHDLSLVSHFCDSLAVMYLSQIVESGSRDEVLTRGRHPYSWALLSSVLVPDPLHKRSDNSGAVRLEGEIPSPIDLPDGCYLMSRCPFATSGCERPQQLNQLQSEPDHRVRCWRSSSGHLKTPLTVNLLQTGWTVDVDDRPD